MLSTDSRPTDADTKRTHNPANCRSRPILRIGLKQLHLQVVRRRGRPLVISRYPLGSFS